MPIAVHQADGTISPPGLWMLERHCVEPRRSSVPDAIELTGEPQDVLLIASVPLTDEPWRPLERGELLAVRAGMRLDAAGI